VISAIVTDIEGTTTSLAFVKDVLFPYARTRLAGFVLTHGGRAEVLEQLILAGALCGRPLDRAAIVRELEAWSDADRKVAPLKALQGMIWAEGYARGELVGHVYDDAAAALRRWHQDGLRVYVFSSGSVAAQQLLFRHSLHGDLTPCCRGFFDTNTGSKQEPESYRRIATAIGVAPMHTLFLSDTVAELDAARAAGMHVLRIDRQGRPSMTGAVSTFAAIDLHVVPT
jgi:enolase-phosphatase E1